MSLPSGDDKELLDDKHDVESLLAPLRRLHERVRAGVVLACEEAALEELSRVDE